MENEPRFLRPNVIIEPLVDRFYVSLNTLAPVQASMNLAYLQVPMLEAYLQAPKVHINSSRDPEMRGGFFVNIDEERSGEVRDLLASIKRDRAAMLRFAEAVSDAEEMVRQQATGFDLTPLYPKLPADLSGLVEVAYDTNNQAQLRYLEPVVYSSELYDEDRQSVQLSIETGIERPFIMSTPRLPGPDVLDLHLPFRHPGLEELFGARLAPTTLGRLRDALELDDEQSAFLAGLLCDAPDLAPSRHVDDGARIRYFGHASLVMQTPEAAVVTDPWVSADSTAAGRYTYRDLPDHIDLVLLTHGHQDHVVPETLMQLRGRVGTVVVPRSSRGNLSDPSLALYLTRLGLPVVEVDDYAQVDFPGGSVIATPFLGEHADLDIRAKSTYCVRLGGRTVFVGADSSGIDPALYRNIRAHVGPVDVAFLGMECAGAPLTWVYQALLTRPMTKKMSDSRTMSGSNAEQAGAIVTELGADEAYVYAMGEEDWLVGHVMATSYNEDSFQLKQVAEFMNWCADNGVKADHLYGQHEIRW
ncbi:4-amino-L-phenylalanyl-[CmlP-peptidyl-carrier-protein] 3-hydroxylase [Actinomadura sp. RB99]|uniref:MBL fold metallo-hydrolase n=1 Tax=Actinomadura sp. RB99 TaxID=2691577 RepID=UPI001685B8F2|nr:MBL fold metallo-hydrolase [Actinomadura sp. RB99]MBD2895154.1 4-amino-L-phenylalanyl-[CmlP-peptidyl-carrier-protein] 3-hydroxylase [Actinomadura sp. RB99]